MSEKQWTEGVLDDGAVILCDGERVTISDVLARLNQAEHIEAERAALQARIAQLEESAIGGYEDGWHALRNERDALRARIEDAPVMEVRRAASGKALDLPPPPNLIGKRVALVALGDDE